MKKVLKISVCSVKKTVLCIVLTCICSMAFASMQQFYQHDEKVRILAELCRKSGVSMPAYIYPVSGDTLNYFIENADLSSKMNEDDKESLAELKSKFSGDKLLVNMSEDFAFDVELTAAPTFLISSEKMDYRDIKDKADDVDWIVKANDIPDFLLAEADLKLSKYAFGHFEYGFTTDSTFFHRNQFEHNILINPISSKVLRNGKEISKGRVDNGPYHAYLSIGADNMNLAIGRMRVSSSNGITGNLGVGDNFLFREAMIFTLNAWPFTYQYMLNRFDAELDDSYSQSNESGVAVPWFAMHKATMNLLDNHLNIGVYEAVLSYSEFEPRVLSPFILMHNLLTYRNGNENNLFGVELDWSFDFGLDVHAQAVFDQIQLKGETEEKPDAFGFLANAKYTAKLGKGSITCFAEGVYTNPWLYLRAEKDNYSDDTQKGEYYKYDLIAGNYFGTLWAQNPGSSKAVSYQDSHYLGYGFGPNTILGDAGIVYRLPLNIASADFMVKCSGYEYKSAKSGKHHSPCVESGDKAEVLLQIRVQDTMSFFDGGLSLTGIAAYQHYFNYKNKGSDSHNDVQTMVSVGVRPLKFIKTK